MRRGCISLGNIKCDTCHRTINYLERYLFIDQTKGQDQTICMDCCKERGLIVAGSEKADAGQLFDLSKD